MPIYIRRSSPSDSLIALKTALINAGINCILSRRDAFASVRNSVILNYGTTHDPSGTGYCAVSNLAGPRRMARNKALAFAAMQDSNVIIPSWWTRKEDVVRTSNGIIIERHALTGDSGEGIRVVRDGEELEDAPLYTQYIRKREEYRVHVVFGRVVAVQQKRRRSGDTDMTPDQQLIRNHDNGWVFCIEDIDAQTKQALAASAMGAISALGLQSGAVDIVKGSRDGRLYVLEVNTCPGLSSPTVLEAYVNRLREVHSDLQE